MNALIPFHELKTSTLSFLKIRPSMQCSQVRKLGLQPRGGYFQFSSLFMILETGMAATIKPSGVTGLLATGPRDSSRRLTEPRGVRSRVGLGSSLCNNSRIEYDCILSCTEPRGMQGVQCACAAGRSSRRGLPAVRARTSSALQRTPLPPRQPSTAADSC